MNCQMQIPEAMLNDADALTVALQVHRDKPTDPFLFLEELDDLLASGSDIVASVLHARNDIVGSTIANEVVAITRARDRHSSFSGSR